jgi:hypothetical protein
MACNIRARRIFISLPSKKSSSFPSSSLSESGLLFLGDTYVLLSSFSICSSYIMSVYIIDKIYSSVLFLTCIFRFTIGYYYFYCTGSIFGDSKEDGS